mgnify:CR=1 FL=1
MLEQEVRRQAMLQVMGLEVWLPRQQLPHAAPSVDWLLEWQPPVTSEPAPQPVAVPARQEPARAAPAAAAEPSASVRDNLQQVRDSLQPVGRSSGAPVEATVSETVVEAAVEPAQPVAEIPRFSLQLLRSGPCLLLADLPLGEAFQSSDPDFQLLLDILRAARLPQPRMLRQGEPIRWPLLTTGQLAGAQDAEAARACVRDLLELECSQQPVSFVWLLGPRAMQFANAGHAADANLFSLGAFREQIRFWNLPSLEQLMRERPLKPQLWYHLQQLMPHWVQDA